MDRTVATGTGYIGQYPPTVARIFESLETSPNDLLCSCTTFLTLTGCAPANRYPLHL
jgi:alpha-glucuronidase